MSLYSTIRGWLQALHQEEGQDLVEYALIVGLLSIVAVLAIATTGQFVNQVWTQIVTFLEIGLAAV